MSPAIPILAKLLTTCDDTDTLADICWSFSYLCDGPSEKVDTVINAGICPILVRLLMWVINNCF